MSVKLEDYRYDAEKCIGCKGCVWVDHIYMPGVNYMTKCPSYSRYQFDAYAAYGREKIAVAVMDERLTYTPELLKVIYACNLCGACDAGCKRNLDLEPIMVLEGLRNKCVEDGAGPMPAHKKITEHILNSGNYYDASQEERNWVSNEVQSKENADTIYFTGCNASFQNQGIVKSTIKILDAAGTHYKVLGNDECCCGHPLIATGQVENGRKIVEQNLDLFKKSGIQRIITSCAECYKTLKVDYPKLLKKSTEDMEFNVLHITEFISPLLNEEKLKFNNKVELRAAYHDPCNLGHTKQGAIMASVILNRLRFSNREVKLVETLV
ncbi:MAG: heterodisulfide reductase-related iron-sulfur binding cluster, partial [Thermodesulfobacteriota bacterium]|nr:heterodisulfide reductase-related iron-sulfur binding cluster [Thermodesulfobacteriota bacterium]